MADKEQFEQRLLEKKALYAKNFRIEDLNDANDASTLDNMLKTEIMIDDLQAEIQQLMSEGAVSNASNIKKLADLLRDATATINTLQRLLAIDRKTRKDEESGSVADYINGLKKVALKFVEKRMIKIYCKECKIMVARYSAVHDHTSFTIETQCSQCKKMIKLSRQEKDVLFDVADADWRRRFRATVVQPKDGGPEEDIVYDTGDTNVIEFDSSAYEEDLLIPIKPLTFKDDTVIGEDDATREESN